MFVTIISICLALSVGVPVAVFFRGEKTKKRFQGALLSNLASFGTLLFISIITMASGAVSAAGETTAASGSGMGYLAAALATGFSCIGAGIAVSAAASAAIGAISENDNAMGKALIFVALAEGVALYGLLVSFTILGKL